MIHQNTRPILDIDAMTNLLNQISILVLKVRKAAKIKNRYNQVPHLTQDTTWENDKKHNLTSQTRAKRLSLSQQVTTRQQ